MKAKFNILTSTCVTSPIGECRYGPDYTCTFFESYNEGRLWRKLISGLAL